MLGSDPLYARLVLVCHLDIHLWPDIEVVPQRNLQEAIPIGVGLWSDSQFPRQAGREVLTHLEQVRIPHNDEQFLGASDGDVESGHQLRGLQGPSTVLDKWHTSWPR